MWQLQAVGAVLKRKIRSVYPETTPEVAGISNSIRVNVLRFNSNDTSTLLFLVYVWWKIGHHIIIQIQIHFQPCHNPGIFLTFLELAVGK